MTYTCPMHPNIKQDTPNMCPECGMRLVSMNQSKKFYETWGGKRYEKYFFSSWFTRKHKQLITAITSNNDQPSILDIGSGPGQMLERIQEKFPAAKLSALDISTAMINRVKEKLPDADAQVGTAEMLPWADSTFDIVTNSISFHHYHSSHKALQEVYRVLKPGGKFYLMDINPNTSLARFLYNVIGIVARDGHVTFYTKGEIYSTFEGAGFMNVQQIQAGPLVRVVITVVEKQI